MKCICCSRRCLAGALSSMRRIHELPKGVTWSSYEALISCSSALIVFKAG